METNNEQITHVLVEEENSIRKEWLQIADAKDLKLMTYPDAEWFLQDFKLGIFNGRERFYFDQDFGRVRGVGLQLSRHIKAKWPHAYTCLVTAYPKLLFMRELALGQVNDVFGKYPAPFSNPAFTAGEEQFDRDVWRPLLLVNENSI